MEDLLVALEMATNVKRLSYDNEKRVWLVEYKTDLKPNEIDSDNLIEFLTNA